MHKTILIFLTITPTHRRTRDQNEPERIATVDPAVTNYVDQSATSGAFYFYSVSVIEDNLESDRNDELGIKAK